MKLIILVCAVLLNLSVHATSGNCADYRVQVLQEAAPAAELPEDISSQLSQTGVRVIRGENATVMDIWLTKEWPVPADFKPSDSILYPFRPGQLMGVVRFARKGSDFRDQEIAKGLYTLRYAHQPVDGAHVGTSPTYDFLLLVQAEDEVSAVQTDQKTLNTRSAKAADSNHPALLAMRPAVAATNYPSLRHQADTDWWILGVMGKAKSTSPTDFAIDLVIAGHSAE